LLIGPSVPLPAPPSILDSIRDIEVTNTDERSDAFQITFSAGRSGPTDFLDYPILNNPLLKPFNRVIVQIFFGLTPRVLMDGVITHLQFNPSNEPGQSTFVATGEDVSVMMGQKEKVVTRPNRPDKIIVDEIILGYSQYGLIPETTPPSLSEVPIELDRVPTQRGTDLEYLKTLARSYHSVFYIEPTELPGVNKAYWGPLNVSSVPQRALTVGMGGETNVAGNINFQNNAQGPTTVSGQIVDRQTNTRVPVVSIPITRPPLAAMPAWIFNQPNVHTKQFQPDGGVSIIQAQAQAQAQAESSIDVITGTGELDAARYGDILRSRRLVGVRGCGYLYDGLYYVKSVVHKIKPGQYRQSFTLKREGLGSTVPSVPT
jgi:hypothetical protein